MQSQTSVVGGVWKGRRKGRIQLRKGTRQHLVAGHHKPKLPRPLGWQQNRVGCYRETQPRRSPLCGMVNGRWSSGQMGRSRWFMAHPWPTVAFARFVSSVLVPSNLPSLASASIPRMHRFPRRLVSNPTSHTRHDRSYGDHECGLGRAEPMVLLPSVRRPYGEVIQTNNYCTLTSGAAWTGRWSTMLPSGIVVVGDANVQLSFISSARRPLDSV